MSQPSPFARPGTMGFALFALHAALCAGFALLCLYLPGRTDLLPMATWFLGLQGVAAIAINLAIPRRLLVWSALFTLAAIAWGFVCAVVAGMSLGNSWL
jgi:hypothetical protein